MLTQNHQCPGQPRECRNRRRRSFTSIIPSHNVSPTRLHHRPHPLQVAPGQRGRKQGGKQDIMRDATSSLSKHITPPIILSWLPPAAGRFGDTSQIGRSQSIGIYNKRHHTLFPFLVQSESCFSFLLFMVCPGLIGDRVVSVHRRNTRLHTFNTY